MTVELRRNETLLADWMEAAERNNFERIEKLSMFFTEKHYLDALKKVGDLKIFIYLMDTASTPIDHLSLLKNAISSSKSLKIIDYLLFLADDVKTDCICAAVETGDLNLVKYLLKIRASYNSLSQWEKQTLIETAAASGNLEIFQFLRTKYNSSFPSTYIEKILRSAVIGGNLIVLKYLIEKEQCLKNPDPKLVLLACEYGRLETLKYLSEVVSLDLHYEDKHSHQNCLRLAIFKGSLPIVKFLIEEKNFDPNKKDSLGSLPVDFANRCGKQDIIDYLQDLKQS